MFSTLAGTFKDITESPYFPKMAFKKIPSSNSRIIFFLNSITFFLILVDGYAETKIVRPMATLETVEKRSLSTILDLPSKLDFSTLQSIAHQTGLFIFFSYLFENFFFIARSEAGILMTTSDIEIGDIGMLSYRLPVAPRSSQIVNQQQQQQHVPRRSFSCLDNQEQSTIPIKWELTSRTKVLTNDPLGLLNPAPPVTVTPLLINRTSSMMSKPFANSLPLSTETKPTINPTPKEDEVSSLLHIPTSITQLRAKFTQSGLSALYSQKNLNQIKSFALDRFTELKTSVKSTTIPLTQSKSLYAVKNSTLNKDRLLTKDNHNSKLRGSMSSLISQQSSNSSSLNTNNINGIDISNIHNDIKALRLDPSSVAIPINNNDENCHSPVRIIEISSCNRCSACNRFLYDEEIMNGWSPDDSELHTICVHCHEKTIPNLSIYIRVRQFNSEINKY
jgi:hypothetical protein